MTIKILHTGDLHIGSFPGPEENGENVRFKDIRKCLDALVEGAREQQPDIAIVAGDVFHQARVWSDRGLKEQQTAVKFIRELSQICPVVVMRGTPNHDSSEQFHTLESTFDAHPGVYIVTEPGMETYYTYNGKRVQIACLPGFDRGYYRAKHPGLSKEEENEVFTEAIADMIIGLRAQCNPDIPAVLVSHYTITGCNMESGQTAFFSQFEPVVYPATLQTADFDLACFGHIHRPQKLEGCKNTFYCGAISALNFNDEGQERGYWIHEIRDGGWVDSTFHQLPTRQYLTIRLQDDDIREINETGPEWLYKLPVLDSEDAARDKIVRVLYDCTDEHNKAFNHAVLENWLRDAAGAFWVQEITPQKISITVDRRSMDADSTPEGNLTGYLEEKQFTPERIGELVELARPIIAEATEKATTERHTGLFVPVEIEVKNYRNYREEHFSFDDIRFCTINGANGVGKSSLFMDAMADALFEETREGELTGWIRNDPEARSGMIKFTFKLGERLYRVTRTRQKSGKATLNISELVDGEWTDRSKEKFKDTQQEIINIIGMDSLTLKACALIMQDQYGLFLQADKEARMNILGSILGLGIYAGMEELAAEHASDTNRSIRTLTDKAEAITAGLPNVEELEKQIEDTEAENKALAEKIAAKTAETDSLKVKLNTQIEAAERVIKLNSKLSTLSGQKAGKEAAKTAQLSMLTLAYAVLDKEPEIIAGVREYESLLEQEKTLIKAKATYDSLTAQKRQITEEIVQLELQETEAANRRGLLNRQIAPLKEALSEEAELAEKHGEYEKTASRLKELEAAKPEYDARKKALDDASENLSRIEREHTAAKEKLTLRIAGLKSRVELLNNSGCPDIEKASCRFLADALEAKKALPGAETELETLETDFENSRQAAREAISEAEKALGESLYTEEDYIRFKATLRSLEAAEKSYNSLAAQRNELKLLEERITELEQVEATAAARAEKKRAAREAVETQLVPMATAGKDYDRLQKQIVAARGWTEQEKQLPVARANKKAAVERIDELDAEIQAIEVDIADNQKELEKERAKTVGKDILEAQVREAEQEVTRLQSAAQSGAMKLGSLNMKVEETDKKLSEAAGIQKEINALGYKAAGYEELKKAFSQDGIPHNIIRSIIPVFEATATNILGQMSQGHMSVEFVTEKVLKSNNKKEVTTLDIIINDADTGRLPYMSRSGGEKVKASLSVILALSEIKQTKAGVQFGFLFIDEPSFLDAEGMQAYCDALETIQTRYPDVKVMAITHDESFKARFPQNISIYKDHDGSHVMRN